MTEAKEDDVVSVCKIVGALCCLDQSKELFMMKNRKQLSKVAMGLMGEAVSRSCRVACAKDKDVMWKMIRKGLGIKLEDCVYPNPDDKREEKELEHSPNFDSQKARSKSGLKTFLVGARHLFSIFQENFL